MQEKVGLKHAWYVVLILTLANVSGFVDRQILSYLVVPMKRDLGVTDTQVSLLMGLGFVLFYSVLGIPIGRLIDRGSRRGITAVGIALWSLMTTLSGVARTFPALMLARIGVGVGEATLVPASVSIISDLFPRRLLGTAMSIYTTGTFLGSGVGYILGAFLVQKLDALGTITLPAIGEIFAWQSVFFIVGIPGFLIALLALTMREPARQEPSVAEIPFSEAMQYMRAHSRTVFALTLGFACSAAVNYGIGAWMGTFFMRTHEWTAAQAGEWQGINTIIFGPIGALLGGKLSDVWVKRGKADAPLLVGMAAAAGMILTAGVYPAVDSVNVAKLLIIPVNIFAAMPWGAASVAMAEILPSRMRGQGAAIYQLVVNLVAGILGPTSVALLTDYVFRDEAAVRWSLVACTLVGMTLTISLLAWGRAAYRETVRERLAA
ncbi:MAG: MFS transporter [Phycisphaerae bacterium]|nr:MFS transporter [Gemmatimonadaceae bacterium]